MPRDQAIAAATAFAANGRFLADLTRRVAIATESQKPERRPECLHYLREINEDFGRPAARC